MFPKYEELFSCIYFKFVKKGDCEYFRYIRFNNDFYHYHRYIKMVASNKTCDQNHN